MSKYKYQRGDDKCAHEWEIHGDQNDTGTHGVRKYCKKCGKVLTFYMSEATL